MLRYLRRLADRDLALDRTMIPLGSCTMKLNATAEMVPITWPEFGRIHPFAPVDQAQGYLQLFEDLEQWLRRDHRLRRGLAAAERRLAGRVRGPARDPQVPRVTRRVASATCASSPRRRTAPTRASATMAGMRVVVVKCDDQGNVDLDDLKAKAVEHSERLARLMVTYPSTHGVYEEQIREICAVVHEHGGQVYLDGANLNALVGVAKPGEFGADVSHLNLHKTFCIPHGGGGPGVGPIGVKEHLAPFLPNHPLRPEAGPPTGVGPISAAPWGSAGILPIPWAYIRMMGARGLTDATEVAILSANYLAQKLEPHFPVLYKGANGLVAHECIIDLRPITKDTGVTVDDVAKQATTAPWPRSTSPARAAGRTPPRPRPSTRSATRSFRATVGGST